MTRPNGALRNPTISAPGMVRTAARTESVRAESGVHPALGAPARGCVRRHGWRAALAVGAVWIGMALGVSPVGAQSRGADIAPGFGLVVGEGRTENDATIRRFGFTTRRLSDNNRMGSLALIYEEHQNGLAFSRLDDSVAKEDVDLRYQSIFGELKRYFPVGGNFFYYWGLRGGYTRVQGRIDRGPGQKDEKFEEDSFAPLALLALPFVLENPGFLLLAFVDGASLGIVVDLVPEHIWLDLQFGSVVLPRHRDRFVVLEELFSVTRTLQLVIAF